MKYSSSNKPLQCMMTQSTCYKGTRKMTVKGILVHSTGANNPNLCRYVQPDDNASNRQALLNKIGKNSNRNDWNHIYVEAGLNAWIGKFDDGTVGTVQTMPWDYRPWGCGSGRNGSCNNGWIQFEICEDGLTDKNYFNKVYQETVELCAYLCKLYNLNPGDWTTCDGTKCPVILCHADSCNLGLGSNHGDVNHWFPKHGKSMDTLRADIAKLMGSNSTSATQKPTTTTVKTYKVVTPINRYSSAEDAKNKKNAKADKLAVGTYYIYNKYPSGVNGMYNISTDKTGNSAGSWINPAENVIKESATTTPAPQKLYRVRKTWADASTQKGAFSKIEGAKECCQKSGAGYHVFDWNGKVVYSYTKPATTTTTKPTTSTTTTTKPTTGTTTTTKPAETVVAVYDLAYKEKDKIIDSSIKRTNASCTKAIKKILSNNKDFDVNIAKAFFAIAPIYGIDPTMAISQSILETGWFKFVGSSVKPEQHNYCGLGATGGGVAGATFKTIEDGVRAQLQHLYAYACKDALPKGETEIDPRFKYVTRGIAPYWQQLAGRWAVPGYDNKTYSTPQKAMEAENTYGQKIRNIFNQIDKTTVTVQEVDKYFGKVETEEDKVETKPVVKPEDEDTKKPVVEPEVNTPTVEDSTDEELKENMNFFFRWFRKFIEHIAKFFKGESK